MTQLVEIENKSLRERVADALREAILNGDFKPGMPLKEMELSGQFGVSRAPVREALQTLSAEGLVEIVPYRGTHVKVLSRTDIEELYSLRGTLEAFAIERIIERGDPTAADQLQAMVEEMIEAAKTGDLRAVSVIDQRFHSTLIALSGHSLLVTMWGTVGRRVHQIMSLRNRLNRDPQQVARNHIPIVAAIRERDTVKAKQLIREHVASAGDLAAHTWEQQK